MISLLKSKLIDFFLEVELLSPMPLSLMGWETTLKNIMNLFFWAFIIQKIHILITIPHIYETHIYLPKSLTGKHT